MVDSAASVKPRDFSFSDRTCDFSDIAEVYAEVEAARELVERAVTNLPGIYSDAFFPGADLSGTIAPGYRRIAAFLNRNDKSNVFTVSCNNNAPACQAGAYIGVSGTSVTFCTKFFDGDLVDTEDTEDACPTLDIVGASKSRAAHIVSALAKVSLGA
jgi:hypothetical protein